MLLLYSYKNNQSQIEIFILLQFTDLSETTNRIIFR